MKIAVRMDDIAPSMDWERFRQFRSLLEEYQIKPLIGVVPDNQDENLNREKGIDTNAFFEEIRKLKEEGFVIAQHGYRHSYSGTKGGLFPLNRLSEFAGVPYEIQKEMIRKGKEILTAHGVESDLFMAPAHSYDSNTLRALRAEGFAGLTDGFGKAPYRYRGLTFYPISFRLKNSLRCRHGVTTLVVHTNTMTDAELVRYRQIFAQQDMISFAEYREMPAMRRGEWSHGLEYLTAVWKRLLVKLI